MIVLGNLPISRTDLEAPKNAVIDARSSWDPVPGLKRAIDAAKAHGSLVIGQLTHGGRQVSEEVNKVSEPVSMGRRTQKLTSPLLRTQSPPRTSSALLWAA